MKLKTYPEQAGTYMCSNGMIVCIVKFVGWYPDIQPKDLTIINKYIQGAPTKKVDEKRILQSVSYDRNAWSYEPLYTTTSNPFIKEIIQDSTIEELYQIYNGMLSNGISWTNMIGVIMARLFCNNEQAVKLINEFDERRTKPTFY